MVPARNLLPQMPLAQHLAVAPLYGEAVWDCTQLSRASGAKGPTSALPDRRLLLHLSKLNNDREGRGCWKLLSEMPA